MFKILKQIAIKIQQLSLYVVKKLAKNSEFLMPFLFLYFFSPFFLRFFKYAQRERWEDISFTSFIEEFSNFFAAKSFDTATLVIPLILGFLFFNSIFLLVTKNKKDALNILERFFAIIPYIFFIIELSYSLVDSCLLFFKSTFSIEDARVVWTSYVYPILFTYSKLPGLKSGLFGLFLFYFNYIYVGRNKLKYSHFVRYHYVQAMLTNSFLAFILHSFYLFLKYNPGFELKAFIGFNIYAFFVALNLFYIFSALLGKETKITFLDDAIIYHIGPRDNFLE
jgi:hypothetical protein